jgi:glycosyltransferase involved in cell wall biosynthesis
MAQSMDGLQMAIVNDGGDPEAVEAVVGARREEIRGRAVVIHHQVARGMEAATNSGLAATDSQFVTVLDDDDTWHPRFLELTVAAAESTGAMGVVTATEAVYENTDYGDIRLFDWFRFDPMADLALPPEVGGVHAPLPPTSLFRLLSGNQFPPCSFLYRREVLDEIGLYDEGLPVLGDWDFNIRFLLAHDIHFLDQPLAFYHHRIGHSAEFLNSVSGKDGIHDRVREELLNRYLRRDLERGVVGIGVLANYLHQQRRQRADQLAAARYSQTRCDSVEQLLSALVDRMDSRGVADPDGSVPPRESPAAAPARPSADRGWRKSLGRRV